MFDCNIEENKYVELPLGEVIIKDTDTLEMFLAKKGMRQTGYIELDFLLTREIANNHLSVDEVSDKPLGEGIELDGLRSIFVGEYVKEETPGIYYYLLIQQNRYLEENSEEGEDEIHTEIREMWNKGQNRGKCIINGVERKLWTDVYLEKGFRNYFPVCVDMPLVSRKRLFEGAYTENRVLFLFDELSKQGYEYRGEQKSNVSGNVGARLQFVKYDTLEGRELYVDEDGIVLCQLNELTSYLYLQGENAEKIYQDKWGEHIIKAGLVKEHKATFELLAEQDDKAVYSDILKKNGYTLVNTKVDEDQTKELYRSPGGYVGIELCMKEEMCEINVNDVFSDEEGIRYQRNVF